MVLLYQYAKELRSLSALRLGLYCQRSNPSPHRVAIGSRVGGQASTEQMGPKILKFADFDGAGIDEYRVIAVLDICNGKSQREERVHGLERMHVFQPRRAQSPRVAAHIRAE